MALMLRLGLLPLRITVLGALLLGFAAALLAGCGGSVAGAPASNVELLNVSYDPTRELWRELNAHFIEQYRADKGIDVSIKQSHAGSSSEARAVIDGLDADVVTLALWSDTDAIRKRGLIKSGWEERLTNHSLSPISEAVFVRHAAIFPKLISSRLRLSLRAGTRRSRNSSPMAASLTQSTPRPAHQITDRNKHAGGRAM
jgi:ABC-type sulfate transport system substrate-binding protein